jgi:hypothetical protein
MLAGDVVWIPAGVKHWHGAAANAGVTHIGIQESVDGKSVEWMEKVSDEQYRQAGAQPGVAGSAASGAGMAEKFRRRRG